MRPYDIINADNPDSLLNEIIQRFHHEGPVSQEDLETLAYIKVFHEEEFSRCEAKLMFLLGLFYKTNHPKDVVSLAYSVFSFAIQEETSQTYTPVQASIRNNISKNKYFSFSAPTSTGKSFLLRELVKHETGDIIIVVPSRALIAEYMFKVKEIVNENKDVLVLQFIDDVNKSKTKRRIFIVTPERAKEIFKYHKIFNVSLFLYDEAQISEEKGRRGVEFDALVRRIDRIFPNARKVFAHPFVSNPEAQFHKHNIKLNSDYHAYNQNAVGKMYFSYDSKKHIFEHFSPFIKQANLKENKLPAEEDVVSAVIKKGGSILIYVSKASIYKRTFIKEFQNYIEQCGPASPDAQKIVKEIQELIGAADGNSQLVELMKRGIVIHHGSIPLNIRFLIEKYTADRHARICFATSTLIQGINMPFDLVWVDNARFEGSSEDQVLGLKNLIGRAGRATNAVNHFDYGYVIVKNIKTFSERINILSRISENSQLDEGSDEINSDLDEFIDATRNGAIDNEYKLPITKMERLRSEEAKSLVVTALNKMFIDGEIISGDEYRSLSKEEQKEIKDSLKGIFELSINRKMLVGEQSVLSRAISILLWQIQGKSFREILGFTHSYLTNRDARRNLLKRYKAGELSHEQYKNELSNVEVKYSPTPRALPDSSARVRLPSSFGKKFSDFNYDRLVYDTYDYLDKVISFSLSDVYSAAFGQFYDTTKDPRALSMVNYFKYGTDEAIEIWLLRYGFSMEEIQVVKKHVVAIDANGITFKKSIDELKNDFIIEQVERYK